jgi:hypothetical protein
MNSKRLAIFSAFVIFSGLLILAILSTTILSSVRSALADTYDGGYDEGCFDARRDLQGLNGHGYDESISHGYSEYRVGYVNGYRACWNGEDKPSAYSEDNADSYSNGYDRGYEDGQDNPINEQIRSGESGHSEEYVNGYLEGFFDGCLYVEANDKDVCDSAMDA